jgi:hypothetical protein
VNVPPFLVGLGLLFWGWASGLWWAAIGLALAAESPRLARARWDFEPRDYERVADLCSVAFLALMAWQWFASRRGAEGLLTGLIWMPVLFFALLLLQRYGASGRVPLSALFWSMRHRGPLAGAAPSARIDHGYFGLCLLSAACANPRSPAFFAGAAALAAFALWPARGAGRRAGAWGLALGAALGLAWGLQFSLVAAQARVEQIALEYLRDRVFGRTDPFRAQTAIGEIGRLKLSDRIVWRVEGAARGPLLLREAAYNNFAHDSWFAQSGEFRPLPPEGEAGWIIAVGDGGAPLRISGGLRRGQGVLPLPAGTFRLDRLNVGKAEINRLGAVRVSEGPALVSFEARADAGRLVEDAPLPADTAVPARMRPVLQAALDEAGAGTGRPRERAGAVLRWFRREFGYTMRLGTGGERRSVERFLAEDRRGHCEYFATAAVLMLREAGVPARYVTGYLADEWSALEEALLVRARHGHAWAEAWIDGRWEDVDATPPGWFEAEAAEAPALQGAWDLLSWLGFRFERWRSGGEENQEPGASALWLLAIVPLAGWVAWRVTRRRRADGPGRAARGGDATLPADSPIEPLLERLSGLGFERPPGEPVRRWLAGLPLPAHHEALARLAARHARWRFDPAAQSSGEAEVLAAEARRLAQSIQAPAAPGAGSA